MQRIWYKLSKDQLKEYNFTLKDQHEEYPGYYNVKCHGVRGPDIFDPPLENHSNNYHINIFSNWKNVLSYWKIGILKVGIPIVIVYYLVKCIY